ncbi:MAG TPA: nucleotide exchange factor GrpE [Thermoplasmatales archaeon]|nr:nucleotide exchange factor GrpE [Thermoplasmatales archaeon]
MSDSTTKGKKTSTKKINELKSRIEELEEQLREKNDALLRSYADFQNYQKRMERELENKAEEVKREFIEELINIYELLREAYEDKNPKEGLKSILKKIEEFFEREEIKPIDCIGKSFDHNLHHAVSIIHDKNKDNIIVDEVKRGYTVKGKLLRPSLVVVAKQKEGE